MRILTLHVNSIYVKAVKKAIKQAEEINDAFKKGLSVNEALVVFIAIESKDNDTCINKLVENIKEIADSVKANRIVLYPYAHLSSDLAKPSKALELLKKARSELSKHFELIAVPFGWYKAFSVDVKGHPLAELSRTITAEQVKAEVSKALEAEKKAKSEWFIIDTNGKLHSIKLKNGTIVGFDFSKYKNLEKFARYEMKKVRAVDKQPIHVKLMRKLELVDYEPASDPGHFRFYPKGRLIKALLEAWVNKNVAEYGGLEVETPIMYDIEHPALKSYLHRFPARQYTIQTPNKKVFLRFAACFGQFIMASNAIISYKALPLRLYELTKYSFRVEQRGELTGLRRLRCFTMPDCHAICKDIEQAKQEMRIRFMLAKKVLEGIGFSMQDDFELAIRVTKDFWEQNKDFVVSLVKAFGKPALLEMWDERFFYFVLKYELNFVDTLDKASALATDQIDVENAQRYGITYVDKDNKRKTPVILHLSPSGSLERVMYALLEKAWMEAEKTKSKPCLPLWLCPTQVRIVPVSEKYNEEAIEIAKDLNENEQIRADVDDRDMQLSKKILEAEQEWIPYIVVLGEKELKQEMLTVRMRKENKIEALKPHELKDLIKKQTAEKPFRPLPLPMLLSKRPKFV